MNDPSTGHLLLYVALIVITMAGLETFEFRRTRAGHPRPARRDHRRPDVRRKAA